MPTVTAFDAGKTVKQVTTIQVTLDYPTDIRAKKSILSLKAFFVNLLKWFKAVFNTLKIRRIPRMARPVNTPSAGMVLSPLKQRSKAWFRMKGFSA